MTGPEAPGSQTDLVSAIDAANLLGVKTATVYTYVSRGHLTAHRRPGDRSSWFSRSEVEMLRQRTGRRGTSTGREPVVSAITLIADGEYWYRGRAPGELAHTHTFEQVAELLWTGRLGRRRTWDVAPLDANRLGATAAIASAPRPLDALRVAASALAVGDEVRFGIGSDALVMAARHLLIHLVQALPERSQPIDGSLAAAVWSRLSRRAPERGELATLNGALILMADHGVAPSTLAARTAASYRADLYGVVEAGLAIMAGGWHGGRAMSAEQMLEQIERGDGVARVVGERSRQGSIPALGQPRYPHGDPRYRLLLDLIESSGSESMLIPAMKELEDLTQARALPRPSVELALALMSRAFGFVRGSSEAVFAIGRSAGWLAHAMEEYERSVPQSPEFRYVGPSPLLRSIRA